ncbi:MAG: Tfp pilus assembly protein FimT/FimU [Planctomycetaceae bacterium]
MADTRHEKVTVYVASPRTVTPVASRRGFTLTEVLVTIAIVVILMTLFGGAISAARSSAAGNGTRGTVARIDQVISAQFRRYETRSVSRSLLTGLGITNPSAARAWYVRRNMITADMPDRWSDVAVMAADPATFKSATQRSYADTYTRLSPTAQYGGGECLFMIIMQGGLADCIDCNGLAKAKIGDKDGDGAFEFWDEWNNPIDYILWAPAFQNSGDTTAFFTGLDAAFPGTGAVRPSLGMRPLIYSAGPDREYGLERNGDAVTLSRGAGPVGRDCGNPQDATTKTSGGPATGAGGYREDNIVNVEF